MVFSSPLFLLLFLPFVLAVYFVLPGLRLRNHWLLLASLFFYTWGETGFILLLLGSTLINFGLGKWVERSEKISRRKQVVALAVAVNVGFLAFFKYARLAVASLDSPLQYFGLSPLPVPQITLPIGISFFTFHALSYIIDIYRRKWPAARDPRDVALYIFFFPQLIAGPILRWNAIAPQLEQRRFNDAVFAEGIRRFVGGLAKKMIIANTVALPADQIFALPAAQLSLATAWFGILCYTLQIYFDFSGYSDMAVGLGKMFGFQFLENFNFPYAAQSIKDFWRRWHISLSTWFRDYLYIPLGGNRVSVIRNHLNLILVFFLCGLWHGASWTFVVWGLYHGVFLVLERTSWGDLLGRFPRPFRHGYTIVVVMLGWVLFRSDTFGSATAYWGALFGTAHSAEAQPLARYASKAVLWAVGLGVVFSVLPWSLCRAIFSRLTLPAPRPMRGVLWGVGNVAEIVLILALLFFCAMCLADGTYNPFIYFRF
jgi:alginate O-acetyltransferase complex protein AlgI